MILHKIDIIKELFFFKRIVIFVMGVASVVVDRGGDNCGWSCDNCGFL